MSFRTGPPGPKSRGPAVGSHGASKGNDDRLDGAINKNNNPAAHAAQVVPEKTSGPPCPRCARPMSVCEHKQIGVRQRRQPFFYRRWFRCCYADCVTTLVMPPEFVVWNDNPAGQQAIPEQLRLPWGDL